jgi:alkylhydroperoxidase/carboxymuconolactone decarboxylase family protein YurZ
MKKSLPQSVIKFESKYPEIWKAFAALGEKCHEKGPLDEKTRRLVKLGIAIAARHEGAVHSATRNALNAGITPEEMLLMLLSFGLYLEPWSAFSVPDLKSRGHVLGHLA